MSTETTVAPEQEGTGWRRAAVLFVLLVLTSLVPAAMLVAVPLLILIVVLGFIPGLVFDVTNGPVTVVADALEAAGAAAAATALGG